MLLLLCGPPAAGKTTIAGKGRQESFQETLGKANMTVPKLVYDDDCGFCTWSVEFVARHGEFTLLGFSDLSPDQRDRLPANYEECAYLVTDDRVYSCGEAMEEAFARTDLTSAQIVPLVRQLPGHSQARDGIYRWIAENRDLFGTVISSEPPAQQSR